MKRLIVLSFLAVAAAGLGGCRSASPAITVDGVDISIDEFEAQLRDLSQSEYFRAQAPDLFVGDCGPEAPTEPVDADGLGELVDAAPPRDCRISESGVSQWATNRILLDLYLAEAERRGIEVSADEAEASRSTFPEGFFVGMPEAFAERWIRENATVTALAQSLSADDPTVDPVAELQVELVRNAQIDLDPRYGVWDPAGGAVSVIGLVPLRERVSAGGD